VDGFVCRQFGIDTQGAKHIQCVLDLRSKAVPKLQRKLTISRGKHTDEMVLERLDSAFGGVHVMVVWLNQHQKHCFGVRYNFMIWFLIVHDIQFDALTFW
jgi:hypothetical protein